jgi:predicted DCC family thiol-disulfide oxidoreductase YuxK
MDERKPIILFDGICNFCSALVKFVIHRDKKKIFRFAALQSNTGETLLKKYRLTREQNDTFILIENGKAHQRSNAALRLYNRLPWYWKWTQLFWIFPKFIRDAVYNFIAKNRYKWFGKREECMVPTAELKERFLE